MSDCNKQIRSFVLGIIVWGIVTILLKMNKKSEAFTIGSSFDDHAPRDWNWRDENWWRTNDQELGSGGSDIPTWGSGGAYPKQIDNEGELIKADALLRKIGSSTDEALNEIERALKTYESERSLAAQDIGSRIEEDRAYAQEMITALDRALHDAGISIRQRRLRLKELYQAIKQMALSGSIEWDEIRRMLHDGVGHPDNHSTPVPPSSDSTVGGTVGEPEVEPADGTGGGPPGGTGDGPPGGTVAGTGDGPPGETGDAATAESFRQKRRESFRQKRKVSKRVPLPSIALTSLGN